MYIVALSWAWTSFFFLLEKATTTYLIGRLLPQHERSRQVGPFFPCKHVLLSVSHPCLCLFSLLSSPLLSLPFQQSFPLLLNLLRITPNPPWDYLSCALLSLHNTLTSTFSHIRHENALDSEWRKCWRCLEWLALSRRLSSPSWRERATEVLIPCTTVGVDFFFGFLCSSFSGVFGFSQYAGTWWSCWHSSQTRTESFILGDNEKKIEEKADTRMRRTFSSIAISWTLYLWQPFLGTPSTSIFTINKEDHTIGNLLRGRLLQNRHVTFAAYKVCCGNTNIPLTSNPLGFVGWN